MTEKVYNVLFLCTGNSARSILGEAILNMDGEGRFRAFSAGSKPKGEVHPLAIKELQAMGLPTDNLTSKSWDVFSSSDAPKMDSFLPCAIALLENLALCGSVTR